MRHKTNEADMTSVNCIMNYASSHATMTAKDLASAYDINPSSARQHLSRLTASGNLVRVGYGTYALPSEKEQYPIDVSDEVKSVYSDLAAEYPFADFCVYSGNVYQPLQHHLSINHAIYVETNRDTVNSVFSNLKEKHQNVYKQPDAPFMNDYVDLRSDCIIVKPLVTESPLQSVDGVPSPTLEKLLVDILKDADLEYLRGMEFNYMMESALSQYQLSITKLLRYARRRNVQKQIQTKLDQYANERP